MGDCIAMPNHIIDADIPMANGQHPKKPGNWGRGESRSLQNFYSELIDARILRPHPQETIIPSLPPLLHPGPLLIPHGRGRRYKVIIAGGGVGAEVVVAGRIIRRSKTVLYPQLPG